MQALEQLLILFELMQIPRSLIAFTMIVITDLWTLTALKFLKRRILVLLL